MSDKGVQIPLQGKDAFFYLTHYCPRVFTII